MNGIIVKTERDARAANWTDAVARPAGAVGTLAGGVVGLIAGSVAFSAVAGPDPQFAVFAAVTVPLGLFGGLIGAMLGWAVDSARSGRRAPMGEVASKNPVGATRPRAAA